MLEGETLAERAWRVLGEACEERIAVGKAADGLELPFPVVDDGTRVRGADRRRDRRAPARHDTRSPSSSRSTARSSRPSCCGRSARQRQCPRPAPFRARTRGDLPELERPRGRATTRCAASSPSRRGRRAPARGRRHARSRPSCGSALGDVETSPLSTTQRPRRQLARTSRPPRSIIVATRLLAVVADPAAAQEVARAELVVDRVEPAAHARPHSASSSRASRSRASRRGRARGPVTVRSEPAGGRASGGSCSRRLVHVQRRSRRRPRRRGARRGSPRPCAGRASRRSAT